MSARIYLKVSRDKSLLRKHPWIFSLAINKIKGKPMLGDTVDIYDHKEKWLARGAYSPESQIRVRVWTFNENEEIDSDFFRKKLLNAQSRRDWFIEEGGLTGYRLIAGESDGLPGITIDKYDNLIVCQLLSAGADFHRYTLVEVLKSLYPECSIYERSDVDVRKKEGLEPVTGWLTKPLASTACIIKEHGLSINVDVAKGHKTGFYLDQRDSRVTAGRYSKGKSVLNCFSYTGTFALHCAANDAKEVINVDVSQSALDLARTQIVAPFNGRITKLPISPQNRLRTGDTVLTLYDTDAIEIRAQIPLKYLPTFEFALQQKQPITGDFTNLGQAIPITLSRLSGAIEKGKGGIDGLFSIEVNPRTQQAFPITVGRSLSISLELPAVNESIIVPTQAIYGQDRIYTVQNSLLVSHQITRVGTQTSADGSLRFLIDSANIKEGADILVTQVPNAISGMEVQITHSTSLETAQNAEPTRLTKKVDPQL